LARLDSGAFWEFSLAFYGQEPVARACLSLQDRRQADVNILLLCCWLATQGLRIDEAGLTVAIGAAEAWRRAIVEPLRGARRALGDGFPEIAKSDRQAIKHGILSVELDSERIAQDKMVAAIAGHIAAEEAAPSRGLAHGALEAYLGRVIGEPDEQDAEDLAALLEPL
jgi:uncharacterized protein (TIGR02444 family)